MYMNKNKFLNELSNNLNEKLKYEQHYYNLHNKYMHLLYYNNHNFIRLHFTFNNEKMNIQYLYITFALNNNLYLLNELKYLFNNNNYHISNDDDFIEFKICKSKINDVNISYDELLKLIHIINLI